MKNGLNIRLSDSWKNAIKMALEDPQKNIVKKYKKHEIVRLLSNFRSLNNSSYQLFEATFQ